ncbi:MAG: hypothetical protein JKY54_02210 [Flavobacteriales bacterium]|nr:hypothetical protein [Flavobacteriales bacterium]
MSTKPAITYITKLQLEAQLTTVSNAFLLAEDGSQLEVDLFVESQDLAMRIDNYDQTLKQFDQPVF